MTIRNKKMKNVKMILFAIVCIVIVMVMMFGCIYAASYCWYSAKLAVSLQSNSEILSHITIMQED